MPNARARCDAPADLAESDQPQSVTGQVVAEPSRALVVVMSELAPALDVADDDRELASEHHEERHRELGDRVRVLARCRHDRDATLRRRRHVDVDRAATRATDEPEWRGIKDGVGHWSPLDHEDLMAVERVDHLAGTPHSLPELKFRRALRPPVGLVDHVGERDLVLGGERLECLTERRGGAEAITGHEDPHRAPRYGVRTRAGWP